MQEQKPLRKSELREQRLGELLSSCEDQVLQQIIGPFGLTPALFNDVDGGNVTTTRNFEKGVVANERDQKKYQQWQKANNGGYCRKAYDEDTKAKRKARLKDPEPIISTYTGKELPRDGQMHLDHAVSVHAIETNSRAQLYMSQDERVAMANHDRNLKPSEASINQSMGKKDKREWADSERQKDRGKTNAESFGVDREKLERTVKTAESHVNRQLLVSQLKTQGTQLAVTGAKEAGRNALRQALGVALHTFTSHAFIELKQLFRHPDKGNLVDQLLAAMARVLEKVKAKLRAMLDAGVNGLVQGFVSNLMTFLINNFITTSAKIVTVIREGMNSLWRAVKTLVNPPPDMPGIEVAREVSKVLASAVTVSLGLIFEEAIKSLLTATLPFLAPIMSIVAPAITAILTGIVSALVVYGLDRFFDWLSSTGTELLEAMEHNLDALKANAERMAQWLDVQFNNSRNYVTIHREYRVIEVHLDKAQKTQQDIIHSQSERIQANAGFHAKLAPLIETQIRDEQAVMSALDTYRLKAGTQ